jgi:hypothetical protein
MDADLQDPVGDKLFLPLTGQVGRHGISTIGLPEQLLSLFLAINENNNKSPNR